MNTAVYDGFLPDYYHGIRAGTPSGPRAVSLWCPRVAFPRSAQDPLKTRSRPARYPQIIRAEAVSHPRVTRSLPAHYPLRTRLRPARYSDRVRAEALKSNFDTTPSNPAEFGAVIRVIITVTTVTNANSTTTSTAATAAAVATTNINITTSGITTNGGKRPTSVFHFFTAKSLL